MTTIETTVSANPQEGVFHGPYKPLGESDLVELARWEGDEYDLTDIALQALHQHNKNFRAISSALDANRITPEDAHYLWDQNESVVDNILDRHLTR
ncbi:hypothetical protein KA047_01575 [Candidatus Saccharibacteria bacterium]|nr:hypothetical protein [Candidatus Saccharibacteria bacterium]